MTNQNLTASNIKYLLTVAVLLEKDRGVRCVDVAKYLNVARPSALRALECLQSLKLLCRDECGRMGFDKVWNEHGKAISSLLQNRLGLLLSAITSDG